MQLTDEQKHVIRQLLKFDKRIQTLGGYAGTGKTTVIKHIAQALPKFGVVAFTGKAANVLRKKKVEASTIHSLIYRPVVDSDGDVHFMLADALDCEGIIVDESSMVGPDLFNDLTHFNLPTIFVGDHGQLEPVGEDMNLMSEPDYRLETIHRNAGEIAHFAEFIRKGYKPSSWRHQSGAGSKVKFISKYDYHSMVTNVEQVICAYNKTRAEINHCAKRNLDRPPGPMVGDRVMCLRNNRMEGLFNGMQGIIKSLHGKNGMIFESDGREFDTFYDPNVFNQVKYEFSHNREDPNPFDFCWGITAHKAQGDQWWDGLVVEQKCARWDHIRWAYTAASRFINEVYWVSA
jgi:exodeoxyribonuclease-5